MNCYSGFIRYFAIFLVVLHISATGHVLCAHFYCSHSDLPSESDCDHFHCQIPIHDSTTDCCSGEPCSQECHDDEQPVILIQRSADESLKQSAKSLPLFCVVPEKYLPKLVGFRDTLTFHSSAPALRLHLLYAVLVI